MKDVHGYISLGRRLAYIGVALLVGVMITVATLLWPHT